MIIPGKSEKTERGLALMLFDPHIEPCCAYCKRGSRISEEEVVCVKRGIVSSGGSCRRFIYDPLQRQPQKPVTPDTSQVSAEDFEL